MTPLSFMKLFPEFADESWAAWREILAGVTPAVRELYVVAGRGSGKSRIVALLAACFAVRRYERPPGEEVYVGVFGPDRKQARLTFKYIVGLLRSRSELAALIVAERAESLELRGGVVVEVVSANTAAPRGRTYALAIVEEAAFLPQDDSANPDTELVRAIKPGLARLPGSLLAVVSSPYAKRGILFAAWKKYREGDPRGRVVFVQKPTAELNPSFDPEEIAQALADDPEGAKAEYLAQFRSDIESFVSREVVEAAVVTGRYELPPLGMIDGRTTRYVAFCDLSGARGDSFTLAIGHVESGVAILDVLRERRPPLSPDSVVGEFSDTLKAYGVRRVRGDRYAGEWPVEAFATCGITYDQSARPRSELYKDSLALLNSGRIELLDNDRLVNQICALERRTRRGGRDSIDHPPGGHDDCANAVCGLAVALVVDKTKKITRLVLGREDRTNPTPRRERLDRRNWARAVRAHQDRGTAATFSGRGPSRPPT